MADAAHGAPATGAVSGRVTRALLEMVRRGRGDAGVVQALALAGDGRSFGELADGRRWDPLHQAVPLIDAASLITGDRAIALHVGETLLATAPGATPAAVPVVGCLHRLGSVRAAFEHARLLLARIESGSKTTVLEVGGDRAVVAVAPDSGTSRHAHLCEITRGILSQLPVVYGGRPALVSEPECSARGGRRCRYEVSWESPGAAGPLPLAGSVLSVPSPAEEPHAAGVQDDVVGAPPGGDGGPLMDLGDPIRRMSTLLEGLLGAGFDQTDDVETLVAHLAARADAVVNAHRYLLMVRARPGTAIHLHHRGLERHEAERLAAELWKVPAGAGDGSYLAVDIASDQRRYGRLIEFLNPGSGPAPWEERMLELYAAHAAATLDAFDVVSKARRSDDTARTLLSFSEHLSGLTTLAELVQLLADTVPPVTHCDQSTVYLWDRQLGQLIPKARTDGVETPGALRGPVIPLGSAGRGPSVAVPQPGSTAPLTVRTDTAAVEGLTLRHEVVVVDRTTDDPYLRALLDQSGTCACAVAPLVAGGEFLGVVTAEFGPDSPPRGSRPPDLHERLAGLADHAATSLQNLELLEEVSHLAWHDALTGLPNRRLFEDRVNQELVRSRRVGEPVCMFFVDLDRFKTINDSMGHAAGDDLLRQVSQRLVETVRAQDTVARVGGDEFAILLPGLADQLAIDQLALRSLDALSAPFELFGHRVETSASIGIAVAPDHGDTYDQLLSRADEAMYRAKGRGRNGFQMYAGALVTSAHGREAIDEGSLHADLAQALTHDEFFLLYQPYIDLRTSEVVGVEALVRWNHPTLGILEPASFISLAERSEMIVALDAWVLTQACRQARRWRDKGLPPLRVSVNLASRDLADPKLFDNVHRVLMETGVDPALLELEITQRVVLDNASPARQTIERLRRLGVRFTIDDFGTGNSSLNRIGTFPVSTLKIDKSFVQVLGPDADNNSLVSAIISMAARLGLDCVAEGVETSVQSRVLLQRGCTTAQGYFFSPPLPARDMEVLMAQLVAGDGESEPGAEAGRSAPRQGPWC